MASKQLLDNTNAGLALLVRFDSTFGLCSGDHRHQGCSYIAPKKLFQKPNDCLIKPAQNSLDYVILQPNSVMAVALTFIKI